VIRFLPALLLLLHALTAPAAPPPAAKIQNPPANAVKLLWHAPKPLTTADWFWGPGGKEHAPVPPFRFVKEDFGGTNAKVTVRDARGVTWSVKFGREVHSETFTPRFVYAAGYFVEPTYFVREGTIEGAQHLKRAKPFITRAGKFRYARFKLHDEKTLPYADKYNWSWADNPFLGTHEMNGLKIVMMLVSNWDGMDPTDKDSNTAVLRRASDSAYIYLLTDWGSTMGKWGRIFRREKWDSYGYERQTKKLVKIEPDGELTWGYSGKHKRELTQGIHIDDVSWIMRYLSRFTDEQIRAGLIASGAKPDQVERFAGAIRGRIQDLEEVSYKREASSQRH
jgi:hypothetical protein